MNFKLYFESHFQSSRRQREGGRLLQNLSLEQLKFLVSTEQGFVGLASLCHCLRLHCCPLPRTSRNPRFKACLCCSPGSTRAMETVPEEHTMFSNPIFTSTEDSEEALQGFETPNLTSRHTSFIADAIEREHTIAKHVNVRSVQSARSDCWLSPFLLVDSWLGEL